MKAVVLLALILVQALVYGADTQPKYLHLALTGEPSQMVVGWYTEDATNTSTVRYRPAGSSTFQSTNGTWNQWKEGYGFNHFALLDGLKPDTKYEYECGDEAGGFSSLFAFVTAPDSSKPFAVAVYGDMGIDNSANTIAQVYKRAQNNEFDFVLHVGDIGYADDHVLYFQSTWNTFFENIQNYSSYFPYMVSPGNHEYCSFDPLLYFDTRDFVVYNHRFQMPSKPQTSKVTNLSKSPQNMYYSFDYSNVHFVSYSTETSFKNAPYGKLDDFGDQMTWLQNDLENANKPENRKLRPWIVVTGHRPIYSSCEGYSANGKPINHPHKPPSNSLTLQQTFEKIFYDNKVDLLLNGHVHSYERNYPCYNDTKMSDYHNPSAPFNIVIGNAGNIEGLENKNEQKWTVPQPEWSAFRYGADYGYGILTFDSDSKMEWNFFRATDNKLMDSVVVTHDRE